MMPTLRVIEGEDYSIDVYKNGKVDISFWGEDNKPIKKESIEFTRREFLKIISAVVDLLDEDNWEEELMGEN